MLDVSGCVPLPDTSRFNLFVDSQNQCLLAELRCVGNLEGLTLFKPDLVLLIKQSNYSQYLNSSVVDCTRGNQPVNMHRVVACPRPQKPEEAQFHPIIRLAPVEQVRNKMKQTL